jgi:hypothetical protein
VYAAKYTQVRNHGWIASANARTSTADRNRISWATTGGGRTPRVGERASSSLRTAAFITRRSTR